MTPPTTSPPPRPSAFARYGPLAAVLAAIALVAVIASTGRDETANGVQEVAAAGSSNSSLPITWEEASKAGEVGEHDWGEHCDTRLGKVAIPTNYAPPCVVARPGVKGGATYQGVTDDEITIVSYEPADDDLAASLDAQLDPQDVRAETRQKLVDMLSDRYELWGRKINLVRFKGTGSDETSARADAVKVAEEIEAFASLSGPGQESAYAEELASRGVICISCGLSIPDSTFQKYAPYLWGNLQTPEQFLLNLGDYIVKRLHKKPPKFAGDPAIRARDERVFGVVHFEQDPPVFSAVEDQVERSGKQRGYQSAVNLTYQLVISELPDKARTLIARLKEKKVTSVIFLGDPVMPIYLTKAATAQDYFPEWIITGTVLTDTTTFGRLYDQEQWAHAFGVSSLPARVPPDQAEAWRLHEWYYGEPPAATKTVAIIMEPLRILFLGLHMAGPDLNPETFRDGLFALPPTPQSPVSPQISFGDHGNFGDPDFLAVDDMQEIWWDADAEGVDEQNKEGTGMMRYADGGKRYLPGTMPASDPKAFQEEGSVMVYDEIPPEMAPPDYPSPAGKGQGSGD